MPFAICEQLRQLRFVNNLNSYPHLLSRAKRGRRATRLKSAIEELHHALTHAKAEGHDREDGVHATVVHVQRTVRHEEVREVPHPPPLVADALPGVCPHAARTTLVLPAEVPAAKLGVVAGLLDELRAAGGDDVTRAVAHEASRMA